MSCQPHRVTPGHTFQTATDIQQQTMTGIAFDLLAFSWRRNVDGESQLAEMDVADNNIFGS